MMALASCLALGATARATTVRKRTTKHRASSGHKLSAHKAKAKSSALHSSTVKTKSRSTGSRTTGSKSNLKSTSSRRRYSARSSRARRAAMHMQPTRIEEIQQALIREGYLVGGPSGSWDTGTRDAMQRYQQANNFSPTGLPDAKSLMKLGLGPHPLPDDLQPAATAEAATPGSGQPNQ